MIHVYIAKNDYCSKVNTSMPSYNYHCFCVMTTFKIYSPNNMQVYNTVLLITVILLYIRSPKFIYHITRNLYPLATISPILPPPQVPVNIFYVSISSALLDS